MPQRRDGEIHGLKIGLYRADKAAGRIRMEKGERGRILMDRDRWNPATGEKMEKSLEIVTSKEHVEKQIEAIEDKLADARELLADIEALG